MPQKIRKTRPQLVQLLREHGYPFGKSTLDKLCAPAVNEGPPVDAWMGNRPLYAPAVALAWAESRLSSERRARRRTVSEPALADKPPSRTHTPTPPSAIDKAPRDGRKGPAATDGTLRAVIS